MAKEYIKTDKHNHIKETFLLQLKAMEQFADGTFYWDVMRMHKTQQSADTGRDSFEEVVMVDKLREAISTINTRMNTKQIAE